MKKYEDVVKELEEKIPRDVVCERDGGGGRSLSYLEGHYVIDRLNKVVGNLNWGYAIEDLKCVHEGKLESARGERFHTSYIARVRLAVTKPASTTQSPDTKDAYQFSDSAYYEDVGYGNGMDPKDPGKAHELAVKEAVTDALKRCAKNLGMSMGLALYDKTQENVTDERTETREVGTKGVPASPGPKHQPETKEIIGLLQSTARVAISKKKFADKAAFVGYLQSTFGVDKIADLTPTKATDCLKQLEGMIT